MPSLGALGRVFRPRPAPGGCWHFSACGHMPPSPPPSSQGLLFFLHQPFLCCLRGHCDCLSQEWRSRQSPLSRLLSHIHKILFTVWGSRPQGMFTLLTKSADWYSSANARETPYPGGAQSSRSSKALMQESLWESSRAEQNPRAPDAWKVFPHIRSEHILGKEALTHCSETQRVKPWVEFPRWFVLN